MPHDRRVILQAVRTHTAHLLPSMGYLRALPTSMIRLLGIMTPRRQGKFVR